VPVLPATVSGRADVSDILNLIDSAVHDWETSPDAVRYNAPVQPVPPPRAFSSPYEFTDARLVIDNREFPVTDMRLEAQHLAGLAGARTIRAAAEFERRMAMLTGEERVDFIAYWQASPWNVDQAWANWEFRRTGISHRSAAEAAGLQIEAWQQLWVADVAGRWRAELDAFIRSPIMSQLVGVLSRAAAEIGAFARLLDPSICHHDPACFCRPDPFLAARDYRRRTKHRNRRRR
jgi:hypothetical protein